MLLAVFLWGGNNAGTKYVVSHWPPIWTGGSRFILAGVLLVAISRFAPGLGEHRRLNLAAIRRLWLRGGLSLALYIVVFIFALKLTAASHVALYLGAAPLWALLWEERPRLDGSSLRKYSAAVIALAGLVILFWPQLRKGQGNWLGETLGLFTGILWTSYGRQCKHLSNEASPLQISAHSMWMAGVLLLPMSIYEVTSQGLVWRWDVGLMQLYCITLGSLVTFALWIKALKHWKTSQVLLFNNLIPLSTMGWAAVLLGERATSTFWLATILVLCGVLLGQSSKKP